MHEFWAVNGFYLWALTTALVVIALAWLGWTTFGEQPTDSGEEAGAAAAEVAELQARLAALAEALPHMQSTLGRSLQYLGMERYADPAGAQAFALAVSNARGDGFVLSSSVRGGLSVRTLAAWGAAGGLSPQEQRAVQLAMDQSSAKS